MPGRLGVNPQCPEVAIPNAAITPTNAATLLPASDSMERSTAGRPVARDPAHRPDADRLRQVLVGLAARVQGADHVHPFDDASERGEAEAVGVAAAAEVELGLVADADEVLGGRAAGLARAIETVPSRWRSPLWRVVS